MANRFKFGEVKLDVTAGRDRSQSVPDPETPFRIALLGDFSGRANRQLMEIGDKLADRRPVMIDRDNFDEVLAKFAPKIELPLEGSKGTRVPLRFTDIDDFHPDRLLDRVELFRKLRETRKRLGDPSTFAAAAAELGIAVGSRADTQATLPGPSEPTPAGDLRGIAGGDLLAQSIEETEGRTGEERPSRAPDEWTLFLRRITAPHVVAKADPRQSELIALVDRATSAQMAALLHVGDLQALEAAWRAVFFLVRNIETSPRLKLYLLDISKQELAADLAASDDLRATGLYKLLVEKTVGTPGADPWAVLAANYMFDLTREDAEVLGRVAKVAAASGAPFVAGAHSRLLGCESIAEAPNPREWKALVDSEATRAWSELRKLHESCYVGLALPRFLLRLPYGPETEATELFQFEEMSSPPLHEDYLWGNPSFACALLMAQAFEGHGWAFRPGVYSEIGGLPLHIYRAEGESRVKPCAEVLLTESAAERILEMGLMPLVSLKDQATVRLVRFQSIASPLSPLMGRWGG